MTAITRHDTPNDPNNNSSEARMSAAEAATENTTGATDGVEPKISPGGPAAEAVPTSKEVSVEEKPEYIVGLQLVIVMLCLVLACFLMLLDTSIIATAIPRITDEFHSLKDIGWYVSAYQLASAALQPLTGKIYSYFSTKWTFLVFFAVFEFGSLLCGASVSSTMFIVGRAVAGIGSAGLLNGSLTIVASSVPLAKRAALMGILMGCVQLGIAIGPLIGGALTEYSTWRWCFYMNLPIGGAVALFIVLCRIPDQVEKPDPKTILPQLHRKLDLLGFVIFAPAAIQLLLALEYGGGKYPWKSATVIGLFCGSGATFILWAVWNHRKGDSALIPASIIKKQPVWCGALTQAFLFTTMFIASYFIPIYFQGVKGDTPLMSGVYLLPSIIAQLIASVSSGFIVGKLGYVIPWSVGSSIITAVGTGLFGLFSPDTPAREWIGYQILNGFGRGIGMQMPLLAVQAALKPSEIAVAMSLLSFIQYLGSSVFLVVGNTIFGESLVQELAKHAPQVDAAAVVAAGATSFRTIIKPEDLPGVLLAYSNSLDKTFYLGAATASACFFTAWGLGWVDIREKKTGAGAV